MRKTCPVAGLAHLRLKTNIHLTFLINQLPSQIRISHFGSGPRKRRDAKYGVSDGKEQEVMPQFTIFGKIMGALNTEAWKPIQIDLKKSVNLIIRNVLCQRNS